MVFKKMRRTRRFLKARARSRRGKSSGLSVEKMAIGSALYGAGRNFISSKIPDFEPLGAYSDNIVLGVGGYLAAKKGSGLIKQAGMVILANEAFVAGAKMSSGMNTSSTGTTYY